MAYHVLTNGYSFVKKLLLYQPPQIPKPFVLDEKPDNHRAESDPAKDSLAYSLTQFQALLRYAHRVTALLSKAGKILSQGQNPDQIIDLKIEYQALEKQEDALESILAAYLSGQKKAGQLPISTSLEENRKMIDYLYHLPLNKDIVIREIDIAADPPVKTMAIFIDGMVDTKNQNLTVSAPHAARFSAPETL